MANLLFVLSMIAGLAEANLERTFILPGGAEIEMVWIEPGTFAMGAPDMGPRHEVTITRGFYLGKYELTQGQWETVMWADVRRNADMTTGEWEVPERVHPWKGLYGVADGPEYPVVFVSWNDIQMFVTKLNKAEGDSVWRLPTEAEWEYACRAGTATKWSFGDDESLLGDYAWYRDNSHDMGVEGGEQFGYAHRVGEKLPNPWGLCDMQGNAAEWVQDWYGPYTGESQVDPVGPSMGSFRVMRGGYYDSFSFQTRPVWRPEYDPVAATEWPWTGDPTGLPHVPCGFAGTRLLRAAPEATSLPPRTWGQIKLPYRE